LLDSPCVLHHHRHRWPFPAPPSRAGCAPIDSCSRNLIFGSFGPSRR
jgi:hypothetical protein